jgi:hypothetical protein
MFLIWVVWFLHSLNNGFNVLNYSKNFVIDRLLKEINLLNLQAQFMGLIERQNNK